MLSLGGLKLTKFLIPPKISILEEKTNEIEGYYRESMGFWLALDRYCEAGVALDRQLIPSSPVLKGG